jgi:hypothetical protein
MKLLPTITVLATVALVGCQTGSGAAGPGHKQPAASRSAAGVGGVPPAALQACLSAADNFWSAKPGTSVLNSANPTNQGLWALQMRTGAFQSTCTVTPVGSIINVGPTYSGD